MKASTRFAGHTEAVDWWDEKNRFERNTKGWSYDHKQQVLLMWLGTVDVKGLNDWLENDAFQ